MSTLPSVLLINYIHLLLAIDAVGYIYIQSVYSRIKHLIYPRCLQGHSHTQNAQHGSFAVLIVTRGSTQTASHVYKQEPPKIRGNHEPSASVRVYLEHYRKGTPSNTTHNTCGLHINLEIY